jgi:outer membrane protein assembly factor BamB
VTHRDTPARQRWLGLGLGLLLAGALVGTGFFVVGGLPSPAASDDGAAPGSTTSSASAPVESTVETTEPTTASSTTTTTVANPVGVGSPPGLVDGLTMFRGSLDRRFYGTGPLPEAAPQELWSYPDEPMCGTSTVGGESSLWCGTGWTGQPVVWERPDGVTEVIFGAYDKSVHFVDAATGEDTRPPFPTGDIIKGSVTLDPDGFPLLYTGSRDNQLRVIALDRDTPTELWSLDAAAVPGIWNNDWDGNPAIVEDILYEGGENGWFFAVRLNRAVGADGLVGVDPEILVEMPGYTDELRALVGNNVSIESSVAISGDRAYFANSGGRVVGLDISEFRTGEAPVAFDYWVGDDVDATVVADGDGMLYVAVELERGTERSAEVGQLVKLDPFTDGDPLVWGVPVPGVDGGDGGIWATPALWDGHVYVPTHTGRLLAVEAATGELTWEEDVGPHAWSSPVVVDGVLLIGTCDVPQLRAYSLADPAAPAHLWTMDQAAGGCIESTPAVWEGRIYVGSRDGFMRAYG